MTVDELRKTAEDYIEADAELLMVSNAEPIIWSRAFDKQTDARVRYEDALAALTPERVLALCELARVMFETRRIAETSPAWAGADFLVNTDEGMMACDAMNDIEAAFGESHGKPEIQK